MSNRGISAFVESKKDWVEKHIVLVKERAKKQLKKEAKAREDINKKRAVTGQPPDVEKVFMDASIEYNPNGDYYLIKYERGTIRAWGAIKK